MRIATNRISDQQRGITLIELLLATAISAILLAGINGLAKLGLDAQTNGRAANELAYQGRFALERIADVARGRAPKVLTTTPAANTTGYWLSVMNTTCTSLVTCTMFCRNANNQLIETTTSDTACSGTTVIARNVTAFTASLPTGTGPVDRSIAVISLTLSDGGNTLNLSSSVRLGGGVQ